MLHAGVPIANTTIIKTITKRKILDKIITVHLLVEEDKCKEGIRIINKNSNTIIMKNIHKRNIHKRNIYKRNTHMRNSSMKNIHKKEEEDIKKEG